MKKNSLKRLNKTELTQLLLRQEEEIRLLTKACEENGISPEQSAEDKIQTEEIERAAKKRNARRGLFRMAVRIFSVMTVVAAAAMLIATAYTPVMRVYGTSMEPVLHNGELLVALKNENLIEHGDIVAFYYNDKVLLKRAIALAGDKVYIDEEGDVYVNDSLIDEPYVSGKSLGQCDVTFPMTIPENSIFVLGDHRSVSVDSRSSDIGNVQSERIVGKIVLRVWPISEFGGI